MNISEQYRNKLINCISSLNSIREDNKINYDNQGVFNHILQFKIDINNPFELPVYNRIKYENTIVRYINKHNYDINFITTLNILQPLPVGTSILSYKTILPFINRLFTNRFPPYGVIKSIIQDNIYYITKGIILDKDFNLLLLCTLSYEEDPSSSSSYFKICKSNLYVSPKVFINVDKPLEKHIINKLIPAYYNIESIPYISGSNKILNGNNIPINVEIKDLNYLLASPTVPSFNENINTDINKFLSDNLNTFDNFA